MHSASGRAMWRPGRVTSRVWLVFRVPGYSIWRFLDDPNQRSLSNPPGIGLVHGPAVQ